MRQRQYEIFLQGQMIGFAMHSEAALRRAEQDAKERGISVEKYDIRVRYV